MKTFQRIISVPGLSNLGVVTEGRVYRSAQPDYGMNWGSLRLRSVLNLREHSESVGAHELSLEHFQLRLNVLSDVTVEAFDLIVSVLAYPVNHPILVHCQSGSDRTGVAAAAYRMKIDGWSLAEAWEELECYGGGIHGVLNLKLKYHLEKYAAAKGYK